MTTSLVLSIDRTSLSLSPLVVSGLRGGGVTLGLVTYREPGRQARIGYAGEGFGDGSQALNASWQQTFHAFAVMPLVSTEDAADDVYEELMAAIGQFSYDLTVTKNGGTPRVWACDRGSAEPAGDRTLIDLKHTVPVWSVTIPCFPLPA